MSIRVKLTKPGRMMDLPAGFIQVSATFNILLAEILSAFSLPPDTPGTSALKELESDPFDIPSLMTWLQER